MNAITDIWKKLRIQYKCAFLGTFLFGVLSQGMGLFNKFSMHDDINFFFDGDNPLGYGRWMYYVLVRIENKLLGNYSLPLLYGTLAILCTALALCLLIDLLELRSTVLCVLLGGIMVSVPVVTHLFGDMYVAHYYSFALLLAVLGPWLIIRRGKWYGWLTGVVLMTFSTAIYQSYIPVMISAFLFRLIKECFDSRTREERILIYRKAGLILLSCAAFISLYFLITFTIVNRYGITLTEYKGISEMGKASPQVYLHRLTSLYKDFFLPSANVNSSIFPGNIRFLSYGFTAVFCLLYAWLLYEKRKFRTETVLLLVLMLLIPLAVNFLFIIVNSAFFYMIMLYGRVMFFVIFAWVLENTAGTVQNQFARVTRTLCLAGMALLTVLYIKYDNVCYLQMNLLQSQAVRYFSTLITRIQSTGGYDTEKNVCYIGDPRVLKNDNSIQPIPELDNVVFYPYDGLYHGLSGPWRRFMHLWCGYSAHEVDQSYFRDRPEVEAMPNYPAEGSIQLIDDTIVVKF